MKQVQRKKHTFEQLSISISLPQINKHKLKDVMKEHSGFPSSI